MVTKKTPPKQKTKPPKYKSIPAALSQPHLDDIDAIAKAEDLSRSEVIRHAIEHYVSTYRADNLDQRESELKKEMRTMATALRALLVKSIRLNGQLLYFATLPYTHGTPKQRLSEQGFQVLYERSAAFATQFLKSKATSTVPRDIDLEGQEEATSGQPAGEKSE